MSQYKKNKQLTVQKDGFKTEGLEIHQNQSSKAPTLHAVPMGLSLPKYYVQHCIQKQRQPKALS
jgi:hypothetical protein